MWSSVREYGFEKMADARREPALRIDRVRIPADEKARICEEKPQGYKTTLR